MFKLVALVKKKAGISHEEFTERWVVHHTALSKALGMTGYRINIAMSPYPEADPPPYDGTAEMWWDSVEGFRAALETDIGRLAGDDVANFADGLEFVYCDEHVVL